MPEEPVAKERYESRSYSENRNGISVTTSWYVFNTDSTAVARSLLPSVGSQYVEDGLLLNTFVDSVELTPTENQNPLTIEATVNYEPLEGGGGSGGSRKPEANVATWSLSISTETINVQKAIEQFNFPPKPEGVQYLTIGETEDGVEGVDILAPTATLKITHWLPENEATPAFLNAIQFLVAKTNSKRFKGPWGDWAEEEGLYLGAEVTAVEGDLVQFSHTFRRSITGNVEVKFINAAGSPDKDVVQKNGWRYLWSLFGPGVDPGNVKKGTEQVPVTSHIARVYKRVDFAALKLPKTFEVGD